MAPRQSSNDDTAFWRAYAEILNERAPLVDRWRDGTATWHPRVVQKLVWYSDLCNTQRNRNARARLAYEECESIGG